MLKYLQLLSFLLLINTTFVAYGQYSFQITLHGSGSKICQQVAAQVQNQVISQIGSPSGFPTRSACMQARSVVLNIKSSSAGCNVYYTATPCTGTEISNIGSSGQLTPPGANPSNELRNQIQDYDYLRDNQDPVSSMNSILVQGDPSYVSKLNETIRSHYGTEESKSNDIKIRELIASPEIGAKASAMRFAELDPMNMTDLELSNFFVTEYKNLVGADIDQLLNKMSLTEEENAIISNYNGFVKEVIDIVQPMLVSAEYDLIDQGLKMAYYADDVYNPADPRADKCPEPLTSASSLPENERETVQSIIDFLDQQRDEFGFQSNIYYDESIGKYIVSLRGTESLKDVASDIGFSMTGESPQHNYAAALGDLIRYGNMPSDKFIIAGHSLGGGLAMLTGLKSGCEVYAYNPQHISVAAVKNYNLDISAEAQSKLHVYTAVGENVVNYGEAAANYVLNKKPQEYIPGYDIMKLGKATADQVLNKNNLSAGSDESNVGKEDRYLNLGIQHPVNTEENMVRHFQSDMIKGLEKTNASEKEYAKERVSDKMKALRTEGSPIIRRPSSLFMIHPSDKGTFTPVSSGVPVKVISRK